MRDNLPLENRPGASLPAAVAFGLFVFWLLALPMEGPLLVHSMADRHIFQFLGPHVAVLVLAGRLWPRESFPRGSALAVLATIGLTLAFPFLPDGSGWLLAAAGASGGLVSIRAGMLLRQCRRPVVAAAGGLVIGNLLLLAIQQLSLSNVSGHLLAGAALLGLLAKIHPAPDGNLGNLARYLPAIFVFQLVSGLMYRALLPAYAELALLSGAELFFYLLAVGLALLLLRRDRELLLVAGVVLALGAFLCLRGEDRTTLNLAMFGMQGAAGCVDLFLLAGMLGCSNPQRAFGYGNAVLCGGILVGAAFDLWFGALTGSAIVVSQLALNGAVLILYLQNRRQSPMISSAPPTVAEPAPEEWPLHPEIRILLSDKEQRVLELVRQGKTYREVADLLTISDSSVKTYMNRIRGKLGATNKKALLSLLAEKESAVFHPERL